AALAGLDGTHICAADVMCWQKHWISWRSPTDAGGAARRRRAALAGLDGTHICAADVMCWQKTLDQLAQSN
ncbi:hypothetical protein, partial [Diaphorobacter sp.]|uniref:hypothetical protein n=1 Tax=Diaphorobacter sp. TaxID=1934310 RepID=UPI002590905F